MEELGSGQRLGCFGGGEAPSAGRRLNREMHPCIAS